MNTAASRYAAALQRAGCTLDGLRQTAAYLMDYAPLWQALCSPTVEVREKIAVLGRLPDFTSDANLLHFYQILAEKGRFGLLPEIVEAYRRLDLSSRGEGLCTLRCAREPDDGQLAALARLLCKRHGYQAVTIEIVIDPDVLGGFVAELDGVTYDQSVRGQLRALAHSLQKG